MPTKLKSRLFIQNIKSSSPRPSGAPTVIATAVQHSHIPMKFHCCDADFDVDDDEDVVIGGDGGGFDDGYRIKKEG